MKIFFAIFLLAFFTAPSFAKTEMMNTANQIAMEKNVQEQSQQVQVQAPVVVHIQYQSDGTAVISTSRPTTKVTTPTALKQEDQSEYLMLFEIVLAFIFGCFVGPIIRDMYKSTKIKK